MQKCNVLRGATTLFLNCPIYLAFDVSSYDCTHKQKSMDIESNHSRHLWCRPKRIYCNCRVLEICRVLHNFKKSIHPNPQCLWIKLIFQVKCLNWVWEHYIIKCLWIKFIFQVKCLNCVWEHYIITFLEP